MVSLFIVLRPAAIDEEQIQSRQDHQSCHSGHEDTKADEVKQRIHEQAKQHRQEDHAPGRRWATDFVRARCGLRNLNCGQHCLRNLIWQPAELEAHAVILSLLQELIKILFCLWAR